MKNLSNVVGSLVMALTLVLTVGCQKDKGGSAPAATPTPTYQGIPPQGAASGLCVIPDPNTGRFTNIEGAVCSLPNFADPNLCQTNYVVNRHNLGEWFRPDTTRISCNTSLFDLAGLRSLPVHVLDGLNRYSYESACALWSQIHGREYHVFQMSFGPVCLRADAYAAINRKLYLNPSFNYPMQGTCIPGYNCDQVCGNSGFHFSIGGYFGNSFAGAGGNIHYCSDGQ